MTDRNELSKYMILHPFYSPFFNRRTRVITVTDFFKSGMHTIFVSNTFYPAILPETGQLVSFTATTSNISDKIRETIGRINEIVLIDPHETKIDNNYVSYGKIEKFTLPDSLFDFYIEMLNLSISLKPPVVYAKKEDGKVSYIPISTERYFHVKTRNSNGRDEADCTFNIILLKFTEDSFRRARRKSVFSFGARGIETVEVDASFISFSGPEPDLVSIVLTMEYGIYKGLSQIGEGLYIGQVYTIYHIVHNSQERMEKNLLVGLAFYDYSVDSIAAFANLKVKYEKITVIGSINREILNNLRKKVMYGLPESIPEISSENKWRKYYEKDGVTNYIFLSPKFGMRLLKAYVAFPQYRSIIGSMITCDDPITTLIEFMNDVEKTGFYKGNLVDRGLCRLLQE